MHGEGKEAFVDPKPLILLSCRQQDLTKRPGFTAIVDDLLELEKDIPNLKYTEVRDT